MLPPVAHRIADELLVKVAQVEAAITLLDEGATVPFIARYRKELTGSLDDTQLRALEDRLRYLRDMEDRRQTILSSIEQQGKLDEQLRLFIEDADTKNRLEDLYLPYKQKRRTKSHIAREAGLEPLAHALWENPHLDPQERAENYVNSELGIDDVKAALEGARQILMERFSEDADLLARLRNFMYTEGQLVARLIPAKKDQASKFSDYFEHSEPLAATPSHRALAMFRGRNEGFLTLSLMLNANENALDSHPCEAMIASHWQLESLGRAADDWLREVVRWTWRVKLLKRLQTDLFSQLRELAESEAIGVFASNLQDLLLAAPAGSKTTIGLDPGLRTGTKVAVVDRTGKVVDHATIFPTTARHRVKEAQDVLRKLIQQHGVELIAIGNGTGSRETDQFVEELLQQMPGHSAKKVMVNEAGASVYSASELAALEFPDLDVTIRGAVSIARRLQDPLAELVKIDPKSIGVGQYQHDVSQALLSRQLDTVVEDCVNAVGVDINTASAPLLSKVSGLSQTLARNVVSFRDAQGRFDNRRQLLKVKGLGAKTFEQAAGFMRINDGDNPLDASAVHPESYPLVETIARSKQREIHSLVGDTDFLRSLQAGEFTSDQVGLPTVKDIIAELEKPGRDPRPEFRVARFQEGIEKITDLEPDMILEGTVTNVTNFGAFVDVGVHQDGLVHISALANRFIKDPREVVKAGDIVKVKVMEVDVERQRIGLSMRLDDKAADKVSAEQPGSRRHAARAPATGKATPQRKKPSTRPAEKPAANSAFADAFAKARKGDDRV